MIQRRMLCPLVGLLLAVVGCQTQTQPDLRPFEPSAEKIEPVASAPKRWSRHKLDVLRTFALQESPTLWQTVQALRAEYAARKAGLAGLKGDLLEFGRDPETDVDYQALRQSCVNLHESLDQICRKIEDAYIAYKKFQATPGRAEYENLMRKSLEDGIQEADAASRRYRTMKQTK